MVTKIGSVVESEADFDSDLPVNNPAVFNMPACFNDLEPAHFSDRLRGALDCGANGIVT